MRSVIPMRIAKIVNILMSVCFCAFGIIIMAMPEISVSVVGIVIGIYLILSGVFKLIGYFSKDLFRLAFQYDLQLGMLLIALGTAILIHSDQTMTFICVIFGISILSEGLFKASIAFDSKKFGIKLWIVILIVSVVACLFGAILIFFPSESIRVLQVHLGLSRLWDGILNFIVILSTVKIVKNQKRDYPNDTFK